MFYQANLQLLEYQQTLFREKKNLDSYFSDWLFDLMNKLLEVRIFITFPPSIFDVSFGTKPKDVKNIGRARQKIWPSSNKTAVIPK